MLEFLKRKKKKEVDFDSVDKYLPNLLEQKEDQLKKIETLESDIENKLFNSNTVYKQCRRMSLNAEQENQSLRDKLDSMVKNSVMAGASNNTSFEESISICRKEIKINNKVCEYYTTISTELNRSKESLSTAFDPLKKHVRNLKEEIKETKSLLTLRDEEEYDYFTSVNRTTDFSELVEKFKMNKKSQEECIAECNILCEFSSDQDEIDKSLQHYDAS